MVSSIFTQDSTKHFYSYLLNNWQMARMGVFEIPTILESQAMY
jgi:hypothetical protein